MKSLAKAATMEIHCGIKPVFYLLGLFAFCEVTASSLLPLTDTKLPRRQTPSNCKAFPGDAAWPSVGDWNALNSTLHGALLKPIPISAVCHASWPQYDADACLDIYNNWSNYDVVKRCLTTYYLLFTADYILSFVKLVSADHACVFVY